MKVSVIIATYRRVESLRKAIESVILQTYSDIELIVVDDNADAEWNETVVSIVSQYPTVYYICNEVNKGSAETRNIGIRAVHGEYITFLDDDDLYLPNKIKNQIAYMIRNDLDYCITDLYLYNEKDKLIDKRIRNYVLECDSASLLKYHLMYHMTGTDTMMFRKEYLFKIGGFPPINIGDEFYLMKEAITAGGKFGYMPECHVKAYVHTETNGLSSGDSKIKGEKALYTYKKMLFNEIDHKSIKYIKMRHYAVLAFAAFRMKNIFSFISFGTFSFFTSPFDCIKLLRGSI